MDRCWPCCMQLKSIVPHPRLSSVFCRRTLLRFILLLDSLHSVLQNPLESVIPPRQEQDIFGLDGRSARVLRERFNINCRIA